ncbi:4-hydroxy-tetrahydrodipicolinate synthase [Imperialibacter roseus]|uniref:4-hydroxy-tetrahydrodipicolinate synthase n=1 Tax=Imperialibacter roseus TaxID=1324217 RepID=A0ABZ0IVJ5_9BACT|nr:4-hydroxy-tetrahydrodipicolinate synthase [Imperialibacter roseus]WOK09077.1 4-hydroxy-tetrahydrodipicolinate synthase [Imperialibacter roseus]
MHDWLSGTGVALITPFNEQLEIDFDALKKVLDHVSEGGVDYLVVLGTTGESVTLSIAEKHKILSFVFKNNSKNLPVVFGLGGYDTKELVDFMPQLEQYPLKALLSVTPYYNKPNQAGLLQHFTYLADHSKLPIILYNVPGRTGCNIKASTTLELAKHPNIIAIKEASGDLVQCIEVARSMPEGFQLISGDDVLTVPILSIGGSGVISVIANAFPAEFSGMVRHSLAGDAAKASDVLHKLYEVIQLTTEEGNPTGIKAIVSALGIGNDRVRMPLVSASSTLKARIKSAIGSI